VTVISTIPAEPADEVAVIWVAVLSVMLAFTEPNFTAVASFRLVPVMVTEVPPAIGPLVGEIPETAGKAARITVTV